MHKCRLKCRITPRIGTWRTAFPLKAGEAKLRRFRHSLQVVDIDIVI